MHNPTMTEMTATAAPLAGTGKTRNDYAELKTLIRQAGLLDRQPRYYSLKIAYTVGLLVLGIAFLVLVDNFWLRALDAIYMAVAFAQIGFLGHDTGHKQVFASSRTNNILGLFLGNLLLGMSVGWWNEKHNAHHANPNHVDMDPDLNIPLMAFSEEEALEKTGIARSIVKYQAFLFFPFLILAAIDFQVQSILYQFREKVQYRFGEGSLLVLHIALYYGGLIWLLGPLGALAFMVLHQAVLGVILGSVFAPNHKGMPLIDDNSPLDFLRKQVLTARNVRPSPIVDFWYGGLNYQIEHHLFPSMPRNRLAEAQRITRRFCNAMDIDYYQTGVIRSNVEILQFLHNISGEVRRQTGAMGA